MPPVPARGRARLPGLAGSRSDRVASPGPDQPWAARRAATPRLRRRDGRGGAPPHAPVRQALRGAARGPGAQPPRADGEAAARRDGSVRDAGGLRLRLREPPPVQRRVPRGVRLAAVAAPASAGSSPRRRRDLAPAQLPTAVRLATHASDAGPRSRPGCRARHRRGVLPDRVSRRRDRLAGGHADPWGERALPVAVATGPLRARSGDRAGADDAGSDRGSGSDREDDGGMHAGAAREPPPARSPLARLVGRLRDRAPRGRPAGRRPGAGVRRDEHAGRARGPTGCDRGPARS